MEIMSKVEQVNKLLLEGEPGNISVDSYMNYCGYRPQSVVDALNQVFGFGQWGFEEISSEVENTDKGQMAVSQVRVWLASVDFKPTSWGQSNVTRGAVGDARKGAQTDALKKGLSYFSIGNRAYNGRLEDPNEKSKPVIRPASMPAQPEPEVSTVQPINADQLHALENAYKRLGMALPRDAQSWTHLQAKGIYDDLMAKLKVMAQRKSNNRAKQAS